MFLGFPTIMTVIDHALVKRTAIRAAVISHGIDRRLSGKKEEHETVSSLSAHALLFN